ncbi:MAG: multidrug effflux MFS transporter [Chlamydiales bacterium]|nr:multidrug effflux MFS transporter [Chlamydiales bacterium]
MTKFVISVILLLCVGYVATDLYLPSLPAIVQQLQTTISKGQLTVSLYMVTFSLSQLLYGPFSERFGRRKIFFFGLFFSLIGTFFCLFSFNITQLIIGRLLQGAGLGAGAALCRPIIRDVASGDQYAHIASFLAMSAAFFMAAGPAIGGYLQVTWGWRSPFLVLALFTLLVIIALYFWLPETKKELNREALHTRFFFKSYWQLLSNPIFMGYALCAAATIGGLFAYFTTSPFLLQNMIGLTPIQYGWSVVILGAGLSFGGFLNTHLLKVKGRHFSLLCAVALLILTTVAMLTLALFDYENPYVIVGPMFFYTLCVAIIMASATAGAFTPFPHIAGFAGALFGTLIILGAAVSSYIMSIFENQDQLLLALFLVAAAIAATLLQWVAFCFVDKKE